MKQPAVYIVANKPHGTFYTDVTSDLVRRIYEHKHEIKSGFAKKYKCKTLAYYCLFETMEDAILEEKRIKGGSRKDKISLIEKQNPEWQDLYEQLF
jgi:putative endonuclease